MSGLDGLGWPTEPDDLQTISNDLLMTNKPDITKSVIPSRRYTCQICGRKGRRSNSISERKKTPICPACTRNRPALCARCGIVRTYSRPIEEDKFTYGVGEGSHIDRVPFAGKVKNQTTVSDQMQDSNRCLSLDGRGLGVKFATLKICVIATNMRFRGIMGYFTTYKFLKRYIYSRLPIKKTYKPHK